MNNTEKKFFDVFPGFSPSEEIRDFFQDVMITKAVMQKADKRLCVHIKASHLIEKQIICKMETELKQFVFGDGNYTVFFVERYQLSEQYTVASLTNLYMESILFEVNQFSRIDYRIMKSAEWFFHDNVITLTMEDTFIARKHAESIQRYLHEMYLERFGYEVNIGFDYTEEQKSALRKANEQKLMQEVQQVVDAVGTTETLSKEEVQSKLEKKINVTKDGQAVPRKKKEENIAAKKTASGKPASQTSNSEGRKGFHRYGSGTDDPDTFYGRNCEGDFVAIEAITDGMSEIVCHGQVMNLETRELANGTKSIVTFTITDFTDTISCKLFVVNEDVPAITENIQKEKFYRVKGVPIYDRYAKEIGISSIMGIKEIPDFREKRVDNSYEKRVELHMHTVMSDMDSVVDIKKIILRAKEWGHKGIAITDHGVLQAFPIANHVLKSGDPFKIIYGVEGYFVDDIKNLVANPKGQSLDDSFVVFDIETTGLSPRFNKIIEIGAVKIKNGEIVDRFSEFVNPEVPIPYHIEKLTSINDQMVMKAPVITEILPKFLEFCKDSMLVAHNAEFDTGFIKEFARRQDLVVDNTILDTMTLAHILLPQLGKYTLDRICKQLGIVLQNHHRAVDDAEATAGIFLKFLEMLQGMQVTCVDDLNQLGGSSLDIIKKAKRYHGIILAKNDIGRVNLYRLVSESHVTYFNRFPLIPKSMINKYREGLIIGSACEAGELYKAILEGAPDEEVTRLVNFYDYLEIQPNGNNMFMLERDKYPVNTVEDLEQINRRIVALGEEFNKPVVATCDVHFLDPEDEIYRRIIMAGKGFDDADNQPPLFFRTTEEMLQEFEYLGSDKAKEVVIDNTNKICDMIEYMSPVRPDKAPPIIEKSDETLTEICYNKAHEIYGPELPTEVESRLTKELNSIISNGFAVMYIIAQKLVWRSNDDGYLVGSRGSVGSSFVATMAGITEVNPLPAHYICPNCHFVDFTSEEVKAFSGRSGFDMPDRNCPHCGTNMKKDGHDIPFETFLGFNGDKEPDIDLNFSGEYQSKAHDYTEELFGKGHAFRAGTIGTLAEKTAYGYVYKYYEERGIVKRHCEMERIASGCEGIKRTTGQHPGGIVVLPRHEEIYSFTPVQKPANDMQTATVTTHFEYHSIDHNLLKLDILGHDDPTMIRRLEDLTGIDAKTIPLDDPKVMSIFHSTKALGIEPEDIGGIKLGSLGIPEFGTDFVMQMLIDTNPKSFSDLVRISGLSHGTDVWLGNAQTLIQEGKAEISTAICTRDDIMIYLIHMGVEPSKSFKIMESVRKGKGLTEDMEAAMIENNVPDWYIWSCKKIKYMFPKAHAAAYVMMAWRIAWFKVNYPLAYYTAYFSIRAAAFNYELMCQGKAKLEYHMEEIQKLDKNEQKNKDADTLKDMKLVQEMYARGIEFLPIDLYRADASRFLIIDGKIMPSFSSIEGMGEKAAQQLQEAAAEGKFISKDELRERGKVSKTLVEKLDELGILGDMPDSAQLSFKFD